MYIGSSALNTAVSAVQTNMAAMQQSASAVASAAASDSGVSDMALVEGMVQMSSGEVAVQASMKVLDMANESLGSLIDLIA